MTMFNIQYSIGGCQAEMKSEMKSEMKGHCATRGKKTGDSLRCAGVNKRAKRHLAIEQRELGVDGDAGWEASDGDIDDGWSSSRKWIRG